MFALFVLGFIAGCVTGTTLMGAKVEDLTLQRERLQIQCAQQAIQLNRLEQNLEKYRQRRIRIVRELTVRVRGKHDRYRIEIERALHNMLSDFIGQEVEKVDPYAVHQIVDGRALTFHGTEFKLEATDVWVTENLTVWVYVHEGANRREE